MEDISLNLPKEIWMWAQKFRIRLIFLNSDQIEEVFWKEVLTFSRKYADPTLQ